MDKTPEVQVGGEHRMASVLRQEVLLSMDRWGAQSLFFNLASMSTQILQYCSCLSRRAAIGIYPRIHIQLSKCSFPC